jgi:hypothetical protein
MGNSPCASAVAEPPETRTSGRGTLFDAATLRDFLRAALRHAAVIVAFLIIASAQLVAGALHLLASGLVAVGAAARSG